MLFVCNQTVSSPLLSEPLASCVFAGCVSVLGICVWMLAQKVCLNIVCMYTNAHMQQWLLLELSDVIACQSVCECVCTDLADAGQMPCLQNTFLVQSAKLQTIDNEAPPCICEVQSFFRKHDHLLLRQFVVNDAFWAPTMLHMGHCLFVFQNHCLTDILAEECENAKGKVWLKCKCACNQKAAHILVVKLAFLSYCA